MEHILSLNDQFNVVATSPTVDDRTRVLKQDETFAVFDHYGDIQPVLMKEQGLYHEGTRFLSRLELSLGGTRPLLLSSTLKTNNALFTVDLTNPDMSRNGSIIMPRGTLHLLRTKFLWRHSCYERLRIANYGSVPLDFTVQYQLEADFLDIFEVRGCSRERRGHRSTELGEEGGLHFTYEGLDGVIRRTHVTCFPCPQQTLPSDIRFACRLQPKEEATFFVTIACQSFGDSRPLPSPDQAFAEAQESQRAAASAESVIHTSNELFNEWIRRSSMDLRMMVTETPQGPYPYAGVPWYSAPFGRDGIFTALQYLWINPDLARGVLAYLASNQATEAIPVQDAEPGKILHESRKGEMAALGEIPFGQYYGSIDATPLFLILAGAYSDVTGDDSFIRSIWPHVELALDWIDRYGDQDGDGFVEYARHSPKGLAHQGWKDSHDAVFHADGAPAEGPIALCEVQGYVYAAKRSVAALAALLGHHERAQSLLRQAEELRLRFEEVFWCEDLSMYALALDGQKRLCKVRSSNAGHCLLTGIASPDRAKRTAETLLGKDFFTGWGVRTIASSEIRFNPMSYHNGSVWPHDNALIAMGLARYNLKESALKVMAGLFDVSYFVDLHRLPELFCGFSRYPGGGPTLYPVACAPQAWSAGAVFMLLQACLGLTISAREKTISFSSPMLPPFLDRIQIDNLRCGSASVDLLVRRHMRDVGVNLLRREGSIEIVIKK
ncbi:MAG: amylo-alpha-1,6-glucosidase [Nitrospiraceae bacterium]